MRLSDIMGNADLSIYPIIALLLFVFASAVILYYVFSRRNRETFEMARQIPLTDEVVMPRGGDQRDREAIGQRGVL